MSLQQQSGEMKEASCWRINKGKNKKKTLEQIKPAQLLQAERYQQY